MLPGHAAVSLASTKACWLQLAGNLVTAEPTRLPLTLICFCHYLEGWEGMPQQHLCGSSSQ